MPISHVDLMAHHPLLIPTHNSLLYPSSQFQWAPPANLQARKQVGCLQIFFSPSTYIDPTLQFHPQIYSRTPEEAFLVTHLWFPSSVNFTSLPLLIYLTQSFALSQPIKSLGTF